VAKRPGIYIALIAVIVSLAVLFAAHQSGRIGFVFLVLFAMGVGLIALVIWHARTTVYNCPNCDHQFDISWLIDLISPHYPDKKYPKCPSCHKRGWARALSKN
jgi:energy-coupling factor transporter transmembrane protein EcfT